MEIAVPIRRIGEGFYLFGTRKIFAKVLNNKLVVRVGGGYKRAFIRNKRIFK